jgi:hypothetical protein
MEKTISDIFKSQPLFEAGWYYGKAQPSSAVEFSQKELQYLKQHYKVQIYNIDARIDLHYEESCICKTPVDKRYIKQLKAYRKFLSEIQRKVKKALNNGSW